MKINGLIVDTQAIADGLYEIICEREEEAIVAFGMIPKWIMDLAEKLIREKIIAENAKRLNLTVEELTPYVDEKLLTETVNPSSTKSPSAFTPLPNVRARWWSEMPVLPVREAEITLLPFRVNSCNTRSQNGCGVLESEMPDA